MGKRRTARPEPMPLGTLHGAVVVAELDLHGHTVSSAEDRLERFLDTHAIRSPGQVVRVITGKGTHSGGPPVIMDAVRDALSDWLSHRVANWGVDVGGGAYLVELPE